MDARLTQAESAYFMPVTPSPERERAVAQRLAAGEAYQAGLQRGAARLVSRIGHALFGWVERARLRAELASLSDRDLADIGLSRGDIGRVIAASDVAEAAAPVRGSSRIGAQQVA